MSKDKQIEEMRRLADEMGAAISTEYKRRVLADEKKLEAVLKENGWCKAAAIFEEIEEGIKAAVSALQHESNPIHRRVKHETYSSLMCFIKIIEKNTREARARNEICTYINSAEMV